MATKAFEFEDHSKVIFDISEDKELTITLQARHMGGTFKVTSSSATLLPDELDDFINWLSEILLQEDS